MKTTRAAIAAALFLATACGQSKPVKTAEGWKTSRVTAERHPNAMIGYSVRFRMESIMNGDRAELFEYLEDQGCPVYTGGGMPGAPLYATCDGVKDDAAADRKIIAMLPGLDRLMADLDSGKKIVKSAAQVAREAKRKENADKCDSGDMFSGGSIQYRCDPETHRWVVDEESMRWIAHWQKHHEELAFALQSRILTDAEMKEVASLGIGLFTRNGVPYLEEEMQKRLNEALLQQFRLRGAAKDR